MGALLAGGELVDDGPELGLGLLDEAIHAPRGVEEDGELHDRGRFGFGRLRPGGGGGAGGFLARGSAREGGHGRGQRRGTGTGRHGVNETVACDFSVEGVA